MTACYLSTSTMAIESLRGHILDKKSPNWWDFFIIGYCPKLFWLSSKLFGAGGGHELCERAFWLYNVC